MTRSQPAAAAPQASSSAETRAHILAAAAELAKEKGAAHISLEAIAKRAGISKGGLLYHFPRKDALIRAMVERHLGEIDAVLDDVETKAGARPSNAVARVFVELVARRSARTEASTTASCWRWPRIPTSSTRCAHMPSGWWSASAARRPIANCR